MATLTIKNLPDDLYRNIKQRASQRRRSINSEVIVCLESVVKGSRIDTKSLLSRARHLRKTTNRVVLSDKILNRVKKEGRP